MRRHLLAFSIGVLFVQGCAVHELRTDQEKIRDTLVELNTNQILDNLVRASKGLPIIQIDYTNASASVTFEETATISDTLQSTNGTALTTTVAKVGAAATTSLAVTAATLNTLIGSLGAFHTNQIGVTGTPVLTSNELYDAYLAYLGVSGSLQATATPPAPGEAHLCRRYGKCYYWVPVQFKESFYELALITTAQRDRMLRLPEYYIVTLRNPQVVRLPENLHTFSAVNQKQYINGIIVDIDKSVPNDLAGGTMEFDDGSTIGFVQYTEAPVTTYYKTKKLWIVYREKDHNGMSPLGAGTKEAFIARLQAPPNPRATLKYKGADISPPAPTTSELLDRIEFRHPQIQLLRQQASADGGS
jgi:hypothetical protein